MFILRNLLTSPRNVAFSPRLASRPPSDKQDFLEADPYWDVSNIPLNTYKNKAPMIGKVVSVKRIVGPDATGETCDIIISHGGKMPYWEGQSYGVIPPGNSWKTGKPNGARLYSIASTRCVPNDSVDARAYSSHD